MSSPDAYLFTPVPLQRARANGWTPDVQVAFIAALARTGVVAVAARGVGRTARSAYRLRDRDEAESFANAWDRAIAEGQARAIDAALSRSLEPAMVPVIRNGRQVGLREKFDTPLAIAALRALDGRSGRWSKPAPADVEPANSPADYLARFLSGDPDLFNGAQ